MSDVRLDDLWDFDDPAESERRFATLAVEALTQLARAQGLQGRFANAKRTLDEAEALLRPDDPRSRVRLLLERGRLANTAGRDSRGRAHFLAAWELARSSDEDALAVDAAHMLGIVEPPADARRWNERAMALAWSSNDPTARRWVGSLANNMGWARHAAGDHTGAIALFELSRDEFLRDGREDRARVARWSIARCRRSLGDVASALAQQQELLAELHELDETDGYVFEEIGECLLALGRGEESRAFFGRAHELLSRDSSLAASEPERLERLRTHAAP